jgi:hypothetical protein
VARIGSICLILFSMWVALVSSAWAQATPGYTIHQVTFPGSLETYGHAVNDRQDILGAYVPSDTSEVGRLFTKFGATYADLELPVPEVLCHDDPFALNTQRHIAGFFCDLTTESGDVVTRAPYRYAVGLREEPACSEQLRARRRRVAARWRARGHHHRRHRKQ